MPFALDEHPVGALGSCAAYPSPGETVRARGPRRGLHHLQVLAGEDFVEDASEFGVAVADQETEGADPVAESHEQAAGLLGGPRAVRVCGHAEDVHVPGGRLHDEQHVQALEEHGVDVEEIAGQQASRPSACVRRNARQEVSAFCGTGLSRRARRIRRTVAALMR